MGISEDDVDNVQETNDENDGNNFVDREIQRQAFELNLKNIDRAGISNDGVLWIYSGVGGIGKTLLLDELKKLTKVHGKKVIRYDFKDGNNMISTLKALCKNLSTEYQMEFPLFDKACIYLAQKSGEFVSAEQQKAVLASSSTLRSLKKNFSKAFSLQDKSSTAIKAGKSVVDEDIFVEGLHTLGEGVQTVAEGITEITPIFKLGKGLLELFDKKIAEREEKKRLKKGSTAYGEIAKKLETLNVEDDPTRIREFLPTLFAQDLSFWLEENNTELIVFFDTYELLTGEERDAKKTVRLSSGDAPVDWWVGKLLAADRVMWVIAGRYEPEKIGRVTLSKDGVRKNFVKSYIVDVFNENWSNKYLQLLGVKEENLRNEIFKLTGGHPFYLHQCSITYNNERAKGKRPSIKDFGKNRDEIIQRAVGSFDANGQYLTQCLCILNRWTDEVAVAVIPNFNNITYKRIVKLFARADSFDFDDDNETVYIFDRTIDAFFFPSLKVDVTCSRLFTDIRDAANEFFKKFFGENKRRRYPGGSKPDFYFGMWSDIILRTTDKPAELMTIYHENLEPIDDHIENSTFEAVVKKFFDKVGDTETLPSAYFQSRLACVRLWRFKTKEALELAEPAYDKVEKISLRDDERPIKISVMTTLAYVFRKLERYTDEISLREKIVTECERCFPAKDDRIIAAKKSLVFALKLGDRYNDAIEIQRQIFELFDERDGEKFIHEAFTFAKALENNGDYKSALQIRRKIVELREKANDDRRLVSVLGNLIGTLKHFSDEEHLKERVDYYRRYFELCEKTGWEISSDELEDFAKTLKKLGLDDEAEQIRQKQADDSSRRIEDLKRRIEAADEPNIETLELMKVLVSAFEEANKDSEAKQWRKKISTVAQTIVKQTCREPIEDYDVAISTLNKLSNFFFGFYDFDEMFLNDGFDEQRRNIKRAILALIEKKPDAKEAEIIEAKQNLLSELWDSIAGTEHREEAKQLFEEIESYYRKNLPTSREDFVKTLSDYGNFLKLNDKHSAAIKKFSEALHLLEEDSEPHTDEILRTMRNIADVFDDAENYSEELIWRERILNFCREHFTEDAPETLDALDKLVRVHEQLKDYDRAEQLRNELNTLKGKNLGDSHLDSIHAKEELADTLHDSEKYDEEIKLREEIVALYRKNFSSNAGNKKFFMSYLNFVLAMERLADCLNEQERKAEALAIRKQIVDEKKERVQTLKDNSADDEDIIAAMGNLADALNAIEYFNEEINVRKEIVELRRKIFSVNAGNKEEHHSDFIWAMKKLADCLDEQERKAEALEVRKQIVDEEKEHVQTLKDNSADDDDIINAMGNLADALHAIENFDEEINVREEIVDLYRENFSANAVNKKNWHSSFIWAMKKLADCLDEQERKAEALAVRKQIVDEEKEHVQWLKDNSADDDDIISAMDDLADALHAIENFDEEINVREEIVDLYRENFSANAVNKKNWHSSFIRAMNKLVDCLDEQERKAEALEVRKQIVDEEKEYVQWLKDNSADDDDIIRAMWKLADALHAIKDFDEERKLREQIVDKEKERVQTLKDNSADDDDIINAIDDLADALHAIEDFDEEINVREEIVDLYREKFSANPESKEEYHWNWNFIGARVNLAESILDANQHDGATTERIKALEQLNAILEETIETFGEYSWEAKKLLREIAKLRKKITGDAQALKKFDELFGAYDLPQDDDADKTSATEDDLPEEISATEDDSPDETSPTEIDASDSLELRKGQRVPLAKDNSALDKLTVDFRWEGDADLEIDASAFLLGKDEKAHADEDFIFYGNDESGGVKYILDNGQATMQVALKNISDDVAKISFSLTIYDADERKQNFGGTKIFARIVDETTRKEILHFDLTDNFTIETAVIIGEIYRHKGTWKFNAIGSGFSGGLKALCKNFGLEVD